MKDKYDRTMNKDQGGCNKGVGQRRGIEREGAGRVRAQGEKTLRERERERGRENIYQRRVETDQRGRGQGVGGE
jgi:hypothetical protein